MEMKFLEDSYLKELKTKIVEVNENKVMLEDTIFYPESGGQLGDQGIIKRGNEEFPVLDTKKESGKIIHVIEKPGLQAGDEITCILDWDRRYKLMRGHTAAHVMSAIFVDEAGALITGNQISPEKVKIDFSLEGFDKEKVQNYIDKANQALSTNQEITVYNISVEELEKKPEMVKLAKGLPPNIKEVRIVKIGNIDEQPDGGTHVKNTSEVGTLELIKCDNRGKDNKRVYVKLKD